MKNLEQTLAKTLLSEYKTIQNVLDDYQNSMVEKAILNGQKRQIIDLATSIWGKETNFESHFEFLETLKEIANSEPQANLVEVSRFEAFGLFKDYGVKSVNARHEGFDGLAETYSEKSDKWLNIAVKIEQSNADGCNESFMHI